jgi:threonine/homoserine/homoserine lactone efflux protein
MEKVIKASKMFVIDMARSIGVSNLFWLSVFVAGGLLLSWFYVPWLILTAWQHPMIDAIVTSQGWPNWIPYALGGALALFGTWCCLHSFCRVLVLCFPETFDETAL